MHLYYRINHERTLECSADYLIWVGKIINCYDLMFIESKSLSGTVKRNFTLK